MKRRKPKINSSNSTNSGSPLVARAASHSDISIRLIKLLKSFSSDDLILDNLYTVKLALKRGSNYIENINENISNESESTIL